MEADSLCCQRYQAAGEHRTWTVSIFRSCSPWRSMKKSLFFSPVGKTAWHVSWTFWSVTSPGTGSSYGTMILTEGIQTGKWTGLSHRPMFRPFLSIWALSFAHPGVSTVFGARCTDSAQVGQFSILSRIVASSGNASCPRSRSAPHTCVRQY